jgi:hypothetical protein
VIAPAAGQPRLVPPPAGDVWRIGFRTQPLTWRHPHPLSDTPAPYQTPGGRFDAPNGEFATVYFATDAYGACIEKLAPLRPHIGLADRLAVALDDDADPEYDYPLATHVPAEFCSEHVFVTARVEPAARFIDVDAPETHRALHDRSGDLSDDLRALLQEHDLARIDRGTFLTHLRPLTRHLALALYTLFGEHPVVGLRFPSSLDPAAECWAIWDTGEHYVVDRDHGPIDFTSTSLRAAAKRLGLAVPM